MDRPYGKLIIFPRDDWSSETPDRLDGVLRMYHDAARTLLGEIGTASAMGRVWASVCELPSQERREALKAIKDATSPLESVPELPAPQETNRIVP